MRIRPAALGILVLVVFLGTVGVAAATGTWATTGRSAGGGEGGGGGGGRVELATGADAGDVKGWMAIGDVADAFGVPLPELLAAFDLPADTPPSTALKDLESDTFEVLALREWLAERAP
jgi:hypothetical protein